MTDAFRIILVVNVVLLLIGTILTLIYLLPIILIRRFHTTTNILTGNVCLVTAICCLFWIMFNVISGFYPTLLISSTFSCILESYCQVMINCLVVYSFAIITINRYLTIINPNKRFFKRQAWPFISSAVQWIIAIVLPLPLLIRCVPVSTH
jgi:hypothetical protein